MGEGAHTQGEETLGRSEGFPYGAWHRSLVWTDLTLAVAISASLVFSLVGIAASLNGVADVGIAVDTDGAHVTFASPTGSAFNDGVRAGDTILATAYPEQPSDWWMTFTGRDGVTRTIASAGWDQSLRNSLPIAIAALVVSGLGFLLRTAWARGAWLAAAAGAILASTPLRIQGDAMVSSLALGASLVIPVGGVLTAIWTSSIQRRLRTIVLVVASIAITAFLALWALERAFAFGDPTGLESIRSTIGFWLTIGLLTLAVVDLRGLGAVRLPRRQSTPELALFAALVGSFAILAIYFHVPDVALYLVAAILVLVYPRSRRGLLEAADALFLGGVRRQAAIEASEGERARLAADLHDVPIQELSGVIARLELLPEAAGERDALRRIAAELRTMTSELRPPVLDDLGLPMAIESLADQYAHDGTALRVDIADRTRPDDVRDPKVDLAIYRVTEEAVRNAMIHADAQRVDVTGVIAGDRVEIEVRDDGRGLDQRALERARRAGHAGLIAMRHRAEAIGARLSLRSELGGGVSVLLAWQR